MEPKDFRQGKRIGQGQFSDVFEGHHSKDSSKSCALKIMRPFRLDDDKDFSKRIMTELEVGKLLKHENVVQFFGYEKSEDDDGWVTIKVSMELCCKDLKMYRKELRKNEFAMCNFLLQTTEGLKYIHENNIVHRDIKPENILVNVDNGFPNYKLTDFNLCFMTETQSLSNASKSTAGNWKCTLP